MLYSSSLYDTIQNFLLSYLLSELINLNNRRSAVFNIHESIIVSSTASLSIESIREENRRNFCDILLNTVASVSQYSVISENFY